MILYPFCTLLGKLLEKTNNNYFIGILCLVFFVPAIILDLLSSLPPVRYLVKKFLPRN